MTGFSCICNRAKDRKTILLLLNALVRSFYPLLNNHIKIIHSILTFGMSPYIKLYLKFSLQFSGQPAKKFIYQKCSDFERE